MGIDYGHRLHDYAYKLIKDDVGVEFRRHLNGWLEHTNLLVSYTSDAHDNHHGYLKAVKEQIEAERQRNAQFAMLVLSLVAGPALSWISGAIQYRWAPTKVGSGAPTNTFVPNPKYNPPPPPPPKPVAPKEPPKDYVHGRDGRARPAVGSRKEDSNARGYKHQKDVEAYEKAKARQQGYTTPQHVTREVFDPNFSKTKGKILGDLGSSLVSAFLLNPAMRAQQPDRGELNNAINAVPESTNLETLRANLKNAWLKAQSTGEQAIQFFANTIREDNTWGDRLWAKLVSGQLPGVRRTSDDSERYTLGKSWIHDVVNQQRQKWAGQDDWFYYGNAPATISKPPTVNAIEAELWALWISQENFQPIVVSDQAEGPRGGRIGKVEKVEYWNSLSGRSRIPLERILPRLRQLGVLEGESQMENWKRNPQINPGAKDLMRVEISDIYGEVDTWAELESINKWAANRKPMIFGGKLGHVRRTMAPLVVTGQY